MGTDRTTEHILINIRFGENLPKKMFAFFPKLKYYYCTIIFVYSWKSTFSRSMNSSHKFIDIGANMADTMYQGIYNGNKKHEPDLENVIRRANSSGVEKLIITGIDVESSRTALNMARNNEMLYVTVGCHPTRCNEFENSGDPSIYLNQLHELIRENASKVVAVGECGLDYDRLQFCEKHIQRKYFEKQLQLCQTIKLPLFLHCRNAADDFIEIIKHQNFPFEGVVHSFDGSVDVMRTLIDLGFYISINGCSLKTTENLDVVKHIPKERLLLETDCPWCEVRPSHAGHKYVKTSFPSVKKEKWREDCMVKGRNEPCTIVQVFEIVTAIRQDDAEELWQQIYDNTLKLFRNINS